jgi:hypothetical protein
MKPSPNKFTVLVEKKNQLKQLRILFWLIAILLGAIHAWAATNAYSMNEDGISYLDMGDAYLRGDWSMAINTVWSPLYSWILGLTLYILKPTIRWEFPVVHMVNFLIYLSTLVCFDFFWRQVMNSRPIISPGFSEKKFVALPEWALLALGYLLFIWSSLNLINIWTVTPDMCLAAFLYLAAGLILLIRNGSANWPTYALLGLILGLTYLTKAAMFPLAFVFLIIALFSSPDLRQAKSPFLATVLIFLLISGSFIAILSNVKSRLTFSDAGKITYIRYVNNMPYPHWQGETPDNGIPLHSTRKIFDNPPIYEFGNPVGGTYPVSYDPSYWYEGAVAQFNLKQQTKLIISSALFYLDFFFNQQGIMVAAIFILFMMSRWRPLKATNILGEWGLVICSLAAFGMYALVYVENRYIAAFVVIFWADLLTKVRLAESRLTKKFASVTSIVMFIFLIVQIGAFNLEGFNALAFNVNAFKGKQTAKPATSQTRSPSWPGEVAEELHRLNIESGDGVAVIGYAFDSYWARLARLKIVAEMFNWEADAFWRGTPSFQFKVIDVFKSTGAKAIVAEEVPSYARLKDWHQVNETNYYIYLLAS